MLGGPSLPRLITLSTKVKVVTRQALIALPRKTALSTCITAHTWSNMEGMGLCRLPFPSPPPIEPDRVSMRYLSESYRAHYTRAKIKMEVLKIDVMHDNLLSIWPHLWLTTVSREVPWHLIGPSSFCFKTHGTVLPERLWTVCDWGWRVAAPFKTLKQTKKMVFTGLWPVSSHFYLTKGSHRGDKPLHTSPLEVVAISCPYSQKCTCKQLLVTNISHFSLGRWPLVIIGDCPLKSPAHNPSTVLAHAHKRGCVCCLGEGGRRWGSAGCKSAMDTALPSTVTLVKEKVVSRLRCRAGGFEKVIWPIVCLAILVFSILLFAVGCGTQNWIQVQHQMFVLNFTTVYTTMGGREKH